MGITPGSLDVNTEITVGRDTNLKPSSNGTDGNLLRQDTGDNKRRNILGSRILAIREQTRVKRRPVFVGQKVDVTGLLERAFSCAAIEAGVKARHRFEYVDTPSRSSRYSELPN